VVYGVARALSAAIFVLVAATQEANPWTPAAPSYAQYTGRMWDADWYRVISEQGYPGGLPRAADGSVPQNAWAFFPLFPALVRWVTATGIGWDLAAPTLALLLGAAGMLVVHQVVATAVADDPRGPGRTVPGHEPAVGSWVGHLPLAAVAVLATFASAPVLQVAYTESLALLLLATALWCLQHRHYLPAIPVVLALGLTRAVVLPLAVAVVAHAVSRWRSADRWRIVALLAATLVGGLLWPVVVAVRTGEVWAYTETQGAWRGRGEVIPLVPWFDVARWLFGDLGLVVLVVLVAAAVLAVVSRTMWMLGPELQGWTTGYFAYLLVVVEPGTSLLRFALLAFPVAAVLAGWALRRRSWRVWLAALLALGVVGQAGWIGLLWRLVPPAGWPP
jgi:hypothetical protein